MRAFHSTALLFALLTAAAPAWAQYSNREVITEIRQAYVRIDFDTAETRIEEALDRFERFSPEELAEIHFFAALIHYARDDVDKAASEVEVALQLNPALTADPLLTPPGLQDIVGITRAALPEPDSSDLSAADLRYLILEDRRPSAAMRSMLVPGWGQLYKGDRRKGQILIATWGITAGGALTAHFLRQDAERRYLDANTQEEVFDRFETFDRWHKARNNLFIAAVAVWLYSYVDALLLPPSSSAPGLRQNRTSFYAVPVGPDGAQFTFRYAF